MILELLIFLLICGVMLLIIRLATGYWPWQKD